jgi:hypothetical protein
MLVDPKNQKNCPKILKEYKKTQNLQIILEDYRIVCHDFSRMHLELPPSFYHATHI